MEEKQEKYIGWISEEGGVMAFHYEEGFERKELINREDFQQFIMVMAKHYKVQ